MCAKYKGLDSLLLLANEILHHEATSVICTALRDEHPEKTLAPDTVVRLLGIVMLSRLEQPLKEYWFIVVTPSGITTLLIEVQQLNAPADMLVIPEGITIFSARM